MSFKMTAKLTCNSIIRNICTKHANFLFDRKKFELTFEFTFDLTLSINEI